jgi:hypothetical protein
MKPIRLNTKSNYSLVLFDTRAVYTHIPAYVLREVEGLHSSRLSRRMKEHHEDLYSLAMKTGLHYGQVRQTVFGLKPPVSSRGCWTKEAIAISKALSTEPEFLFGPVRDTIVAKMTKRPKACLGLAYEPYEPDAWKDWAS